MKKIIVCTTINPPTEAVKKFDNIEGWSLVVIGDKKTPKYELENGTYIGPEEQEKMFPELSQALGWNLVQRRNIGYAYAYHQGADVVATVDDDNIPLEGWGNNLLIGTTQQIKTFKVNDVAFDPIGATSYSHLWHRGFPLQLLNKRDYSNSSVEDLGPIAIQADFWNGDPDVDAVCRMEHAPECSFQDKDFPFTSNKLSPFNSQNTFLSRACLKDYFLFPFVGRMDDIWASYYVEALGHKVVYNKATVRQDRNEHDLTKDMILEFGGYQHTLNLVKSLYESPDNIKAFLPEKTITAWEAYKKVMG